MLNTAARFRLALSGSELCTNEEATVDKHQKSIAEIEERLKKVGKIFLIVGFKLYILFFRSLLVYRRLILKAIDL